MSTAPAETIPAATIRIQTCRDTVQLEPSSEFVTTDEVRSMTDRALLYLEAGYPVHFSGPAGTGKTTLALHVAALLRRPVSLIHGDAEFGSSDLVGQDNGYRKYRMVDNYIHSVTKMEEEMRKLWIDNRLTTACQNGYTLIYDEFNRSKPEANNILLSVLSEKILNLPKLRMSGEGYLRVHPNFRMIFTSNPEEYAGVHSTQDALLDRMITLYIDHYDRETEIQITSAKSSIERHEAEVIVDLVRALRQCNENKTRPTVRSCVAIAKIIKHSGLQAQWKEPFFLAVCQDVLRGQLESPYALDELFQQSRP